MIKWLKPALDYIPRWVEFQLRQHEQPGCVVAISHKGRIVLEEAFDFADMVKGLPLTPRHRFRVASHSKSFTGRWWSLWGAIDLVPMGKKVLVASPAYFNPLIDASELEVRGRDAGRIALAGGYASHGEPVRLVRNSRNDILEVWLGGTKFLPEAEVVKEIKLRYQKHRQPPTHE